MSDLESANPAIYRIGEYRVDAAVDEISRAGVVTKLEPRVMAVLLCLARNAGQVVSVDRLLDEVWKGVVVNSDSVYQTVATLRRALKDDAKNPKYIANVVRRGYRLVAEVAARDLPEAPLAPAIAEAVDAAAPLDEEAAVRQATPVWRRPAALVSGLVAVVMAGALLFLFIRTRNTEQSTRAGSAAAAPAENSVAVLPFLDLSEHHDEGYFADGISEALIDVLARDPQMHVPARTSSFYFKNRESTVAEIAKALGVSHVLEGSVRKSGDTLRITVQFIRVDTGYHIWSRTFERPVSDIFKTQDEIAEAVAQSLKFSLAPQKSAAPPPLVNSAVYTLYLKAKKLSREGGGQEDFAQAQKYIEQALVLDPNFGLAWAMLAEIVTDDLDWHGSTDTSGACLRARKPLEEAARLEPLLADTHRMIARVHRYCEQDPEAAERELRRALELDPNSSATLGTMADFLTATNRPRHGLDFALQAVAVDPLNPWPHLEVAFAEGTMGHLKEAEREYREALEINPSYAGLHALLTNALLAEGRTAEAVSENQLEADEIFRMMNQPELYEAQNRKADAVKALDAYYAKTHDPYTAASFYACRHDVDRAIAYLRELPVGFNLFDVPNRLGCLHRLDADARFQAIWAAQKLPPRDY